MKEQQANIFKANILGFICSSVPNAFTLYVQTCHAKIEKNNSLICKRGIAIQSIEGTASHARSTGLSTKPQTRYSNEDLTSEVNPEEQNKKRRGQHRNFMHQSVVIGLGV